MSKHRLDKYNTTKNSNKKITLYIFIAIILFVFIIIGINLGKYATNNDDNNFKPEIVDTTTDKTVDVTIYVPINDKLTEKKVRIIDNKLKINNKLDALVKLLISENYLPKNVHIIGNVKVENKVAFCNFSKDIKDFSGSSSQEALLLDSIGKTLVSKKDKIEKIQILVEGNKIESLGGHIELDQPYEP